MFTIVLSTGRFLMTTIHVEKQTHLEIKNFNNGCFTNSLFTSKVIGLFLSFSLRDTSWAGSSWTRGRENATILSVW